MPAVQPIPLFESRYSGVVAKKVFLPTTYKYYTAMIRFLELGKGISSTPDVMVIPPGLRFHNIVHEREIRHEKLILA